VKTSQFNQIPVRRNFAGQNASHSVFEPLHGVLRRDCDEISHLLK
jgi:hypothetical protein